MTRSPGPDFLIMGAPKAGTTALHAALSLHPQVHASVPKEAKYWLCDDAPPPAWRGPGDAHSQQEWIWRREDYHRLFAGAEPGQLRGESTPFYLWSRGAHRRIADALPEAKLISVVRDPIDRAYSNWMHLWSDGLEPEADFVRAFELQDERVAAGWAPFWRYRDLGLYGEQFAHLFEHIDPRRNLILRYKDIIDEPVLTLNRACEFLGIDPDLVTEIPRDNARSYAEPGWRTRAFGPVVRAGAWLGQYARPEVWRAASVPLVGLLTGSDETHRPHLTPEQRAALLPAFEEDVLRFSKLIGQDFSDWLDTSSRGSFLQRTEVTRSWAPSDLAASK
ncbi:sulfotransferase family protein [Marmoricola sp. RAF53]|uniref:sulfotransferase family protein n=1 Tax=Marmoricola sp. RAF53 TaxID=3233059 RepID=UPI003F98B5CD